jgi:hypothetical protein
MKYLDTKGQEVEYIPLLEDVVSASEEAWSLIARGVLGEVDTVLEEIVVGASDYLREEVSEAVEDWPIDPKEREVWIYRKVRTYLESTILSLEGR